MKVVTEASSGSVALSAATCTRVLPAGLTCEAAVTAAAVGRRSMPKLALLTLLVVTATASEPSGVPSLPAPVPRCSPV